MRKKGAKEIQICDKIPIPSEEQDQNNRNHGFTETQISLLIRKYPRVLLFDPESNLFPKIEFFHSKGFSTQDIAKLLSTTPEVLRRSLENKIIPSYNFLTELLKSQEKTNAAIKHLARILLYDDLQISVAPNIEALREIGVPKSNIVTFFTSRPQAFTPNADRFKEIVEEVKKMGFNPTKVMFGVAIHALRAMTKSTWEKKVEVYKSGVCLRIRFWWLLGSNHGL
ncbi:transcription termination factor MTERF2, chloroplastic-like [Cornus florida]|uniref:transcription termination factor MTERF2, chloroplastic-like n=1 Tax=Cornus florida TaxID=4283 RepID=UPI00289F3D2F|nr:transcription termination factor MTERF2, chloroplastic-like [Cornus florida]